MTNEELKMNKESVACLYHRSDLDGHCSGAIVKHFMPHAELFGIEYGDEYDLSEFSGKTVILVDFSFQPFSEMVRLLSVAKELIWLDHHKSAYQAAVDIWNYDDQLSNLNWVYNPKRAACEIVWDFFCYGERSIPKPVEWLGAYDCWRFKQEEQSQRILEFQMGMRLFDTDPKKGKFPWHRVFDGDFEMEDVIRQGKTVLSYQSHQNERLMNKSFMVRWKDLRFLCVNAGGVNSESYKSKYNSSLYDACMSLFFAGDQGKWTVSMYSPDQSVDLSVIAKEMGGGGHAAACGFQAKDISFLLYD